MSLTSPSQVASLYLCDLSVTRVPSLTSDSRNLLITATHVLPKIIITHEDTCPRGKLSQSDLLSIIRVISQTVKFTFHYLAGLNVQVNS